jgi:HlyD family secretion protein
MISTDMAINQRRWVNAVEIVSGLEVGDQVVLSDTSAWDAHDRIRLN